jgi:hypothetical protein
MGRRGREWFDKDWSDRDTESTGKELECHRNVSSGGSFNFAPPGTRPSGAVECQKKARATFNSAHLKETGLIATRVSWGRPVGHPNDDPSPTPHRAYGSRSGNVPQHKRVVYVQCA